jgi:hypothetical protein
LIRRLAQIAPIATVLLAETGRPFKGEDAVETLMNFSNGNYEALLKFAWPGFSRRSRRDR